MSDSADAPWLAARVRADGDATALRFADRAQSWTELAQDTEAVAAGLAAAGVVRGDLVAVRMAPHPRMVALLHALQWLGAAMLPLNLRLTTSEARRILDHARPGLLVDDGAGIDLAAAGVASRHAFDDLGAAARKRSFAAPTRIDPDAALTVVFTSGTAAAPKGVVLTNANHTAAALASQARLGHGRSDAWLGTLPLFHVGGLAILVRSALEGSTVLLEPAFDAARAADVLQSGEATMVSVVPTMLAAVLDRLAAPVSSRVRAVLTGGAALSPALGRRALDAGLPVLPTWGMTEACSQICTSAPASDDAARGLVGRPLPGVDVVVAAPDADGIGELLVRGPNVMRGYLRNADADREALRAGWLHTGDLGRIAADGSVAVTGRRDDQIVTGGENVAPLEVEQVLDAHAGVVESLVFGEADQRWGQRVVAVVVARGHAATDAAELDRWCRQRLAGYKVPREFRFADALPRGATGKVQRPRGPA